MSYQIYFSNLIKMEIPVFHTSAENGVHKRKDNKIEVEKTQVVDGITFAYTNSSWMEMSQRYSFSSYFYKGTGGWGWTMDLHTILIILCYNRMRYKYKTLNLSAFFSFSKSFCLVQVVFFVRLSYMAADEEVGTYTNIKCHIWAISVAIHVMAKVLKICVISPNNKSIFYYTFLPIH